MGARAEKNPVIKSHYPSLNTPLQVTAPGPDPRPGEDTREGGEFAKGGPIPDPIGVVSPFNGIAQRFPMGEETKTDKSLGRKGK